MIRKDFYNVSSCSIPVIAGGEMMGPAIRHSPWRQVRGSVERFSRSKVIHINQVFISDLHK
jgi:hypothetical protein